MKAGKALEQLVAAIQDYLKGYPDTHIESNAKLLDHAGIKREIDVYVQATVQAGKIGIAIECKEYNDKVDVKEIDAFYGKINDIPQVNKGIVVSTNGFTSGAQKKAQFYGIDLYEIEDVPLDKVFAPFNLYYHQCYVELDPYYQVIVVDDNNPKLYLDNGVFSITNEAEVDMFNYIAIVLKNRIPPILPAIHNYLGSQGKKTGNIPLTITPPKELYVKDKSGEKHTIQELRIVIRATVSTQHQEITKQSFYADVSQETPTLRITEYTQNNGTGLLLVHGNSTPYSAFRKDVDGNLRKIVFMRPDELIK